MIASMQLSKEVQLGSQLMTDRGQLLMISDSPLILAQSFPAIVVPTCVTTMVGLLLIQMIHSSSLYMTGS